MELTLKRLLEQAEFSRVKRGYDSDEVDDFLDRAVAMATKVEVRLTQAIAQAKAAEGAPQAGGPGPDDVEAEVARRVQARLAEQASDAPGGPSAEEIAEEARRTLLLAQRTADDVVREARDDAARLISEAESRASEIKAASEDEATTARAELSKEIEAERKAQRERLGAEIHQLEGVRATLRTDLSALERHVEEQRNQLRSSVSELQRLLDDPTGFRMAPAPAAVAPEATPSLEPSGSPASPDAPESSPEGRDSDGSDSEPAGSASDDPAPGLEKASDTGVPELTFDDVDHAAPGDAGAPTAEISTVERDVEGASGPIADSESDPDTDSSTSTDGRSQPSPEQGPNLRASSPAREVDTLPSDDDPFLSELRKAIGDEEPLGPRDGIGGDLSGPRGELLEEERRPWRFGKRR